MTDTGGDGSLPEHLCAIAERFFGDGLPQARRYATALATDGVVRGLVGPREADRIWDRHLFNCVAIAPLVPEHASVTDVGSGAGLPGIVLAIARPDIAVTLIEPLARRVVFLDEMVDELGLDDRIRVVRGRAEDVAASHATEFHVKPAGVVTARALAPLDRLAQWCLPLTRVGGHVLAVKGSSAAAEVEAHRAAIARLGGGTPVIRRCGEGTIDPPATVVDILKTSARSDGSNRPRRRAKTAWKAQNEAR